MFIFSRKVDSTGLYKPTTEDSSKDPNEHNENDDENQSINAEDGNSSDGDCNEDVAHGDNDGHTNHSDDEYLLESVFKRKKKQRKITEESWSAMKAELVEHLPEGVDGLRVFKIPSKSSEKEDRDTLKDGRKWKKTAQPNGKGTVVSDMRIVKGLASVVIHVVLSSWSSVW